MMPKTALGSWLGIELEPGRLLLGEAYLLLRLVDLHTGVSRPIEELHGVPRSPFVHKGHVVWASSGGLSFWELTSLQRVHLSSSPPAPVDLEHYGAAPLPDGRILAVFGTQAFLARGSP
jgi:hypothetical protein